MDTSIERAGEKPEAAILSEGFRPFFLLASLWSALAMALWMLMLAGQLRPPSAFGSVEWHVHGLLYGYLPAVLAGFLLTAVPSWTQRRPIAGGPLALLALGWLAGRAAVWFSAEIGALLAALVDLSFLAALAAVVGREIVAGRSWRNLVVLALLVSLLVGNVLFHLGAAARGVAWNGYGTRVGTAVAVLLIALIGGRIVPAFTRNWLVQRGGASLPAPFGSFDRVALLVTVAALGTWVAVPDARLTALACVLAGALHVWRLARWSGARTGAEPLVLILHIGYAFVPLGFLLAGFSVLVPGVLSPSGAIHAWTAGAIGVMTLAVMTRASLGHSGRALHATPGVVLVYVFAVTAALARVSANFEGAPVLALHLAGAAWVAAFATFAALFAPLLLGDKDARRA